MRCWGLFPCQHSASGWAGPLALSAEASQLFTGALCAAVSPPEPWARSLSPAGAPGLQASRAESSRPPKGQAWDWHSVAGGQSHTEPPRFSWGLGAGVTGGRDCWPLSVETAPTAPVSVLPVQNHTARLPRSLMFSFPNEFLVRLARARVQPDCSSSGEHPSSDNTVCPSSQGH